MIVKEYLEKSAIPEEVIRDLKQMKQNLSTSFTKELPLKPLPQIPKL